MLSVSISLSYYVKHIALTAQAQSKRVGLSCFVKTMLGEKVSFLEGATTNENSDHLNSSFA
jgi:hypothetical protein